MAWAIGGIVLWIGGWWFTSRLFAVYSKAIYLDELDQRRQGHVPAPQSHHAGILLFMGFDLGLLLTGIRSISDVHEELTGSEVSDSLAGSAVNWSILGCLYLFRQAFNLHRFYHDRWRARTGHHIVGQRRAGTIRGLWDETSPGFRFLFVVAPVCAAVPLVVSLAGQRTENLFYVPPGALGAFITWFALPQALLLCALASPLSRARRLARARDGA